MAVASSDFPLHFGPDFCPVMCAFGYAAILQPNRAKQGVLRPWNRDAGPDDPSEILEGVSLSPRDLVGTRGGPGVERRRGLLAAEYAVRVFAPLALDAAGFGSHADSLRAAREVTNGATALAAGYATVKVQRGIARLHGLTPRTPASARDLAEWTIWLAIESAWGNTHRGSQVDGGDFVLALLRIWDTIGARAMQEARARGASRRESRRRGAGAVERALSHWDGPHLWGELDRGHRIRIPDVPPWEPDLRTTAAVRAAWTAGCAFLHCGLFLQRFAASAEPALAGAAALWAAMRDARAKPGGAGGAAADAGA